MKETNKRKERIAKTKESINGLQKEMISNVEKLRADRGYLMNNIKIKDKVKYKGVDVEVVRKNPETITIVNKDYIAGNVFPEEVESIDV